MTHVDKTEDLDLIRVQWNSRGEYTTAAHGVITSETLTLRLKRYCDFACIISRLMESSGLAMLTPPCVGKGTGQISTKFGVKFAQVWVTDTGEAHSQNWLVFTCSQLF